jgi:hypothetical protein
MITLNATLSLGQDLIYVSYVNDKNRLYKYQDESDQDHDNKYDLVSEIITELNEQVGVHRHTYILDS